MASDPAPVCLDLTGLVRHVGRGPATGIQRVERAYLGELLFRLERNPCALVQLRRPFLFSGRAFHSLADFLRAPDVRIVPPGPGASESERQAYVATLRKIMRRLGGVGCDLEDLHDLLPAGCVFLCLNHRPLGPRIVSGLRNVPRLRMAFMVHDLIPLEAPGLCESAQVERYRTFLNMLQRQANLIIANSHDTARHLAPHLIGLDRHVQVVPAPLGVYVHVPKPAELPNGLDLCHPFFVVLGTIEPRKNHALLLDVWDILHRQLPAHRVPHLMIVGKRGWKNEDVFARLDHSPVMGRSVFELTGLADGAVSALLERAAALLFPSRAEGFGLPAAEAAALGTPVICSDLPVFHELLGDRATFLDPTKASAWTDAVLRAADCERQTPRTDLPTWEAHFATVFDQF